MKRNKTRSTNKQFSTWLQGQMVFHGYTIRQIAAALGVREGVVDGWLNSHYCEVVYRQQLERLFASNDAPVPVKEPAELASEELEELQPLQVAQALPSERGKAKRAPERQGTRIYLSGAITGVTKYKERFAWATNRTRLLAADIVNPAEQWQEYDGVWSWHDYMRACIKELLECDVLIQLPCSTKSRGVDIERQVAEAIGIPIMELVADYEFPT